MKQLTEKIHEVKTSECWNTRKGKLPTNKMVKVGIVWYRVYCKHFGKSVLYYILRHGENLSINESILGFQKGT